MSGSETKQAADQYRARGWAPLPVKARDKKPSVGNGWQHFEAEDSTPFDGNVGILLGQRSHGLVDVDLDCSEAVALAPDLLPPTGAVFGRAGKPRSHWLYQCEPPPLATTQFKEAGHDMIVELRSTGGQTVFPPSIHVSGEPIEWESDGEAARIDGDELLRRVSDLAGVSLLIRHWPEPNNRYAAEGALAGALLRSGRDAAEVERLLTLIQQQAGAARDHKPAKTVERLSKKLAENKPVPGLPKLREHVGAAVADQAAEWMNFKSPRHRSELAQNLILDPKAPLITARQFIERRYRHGDGARTLYHHSGTFYAWTGTHYPEADDAALRASLYEFLDQARCPLKDEKTAPFNPTRSKVADILDALAAETNLSVNIRPPDWLGGGVDLPAAEIIACENGLLHLPTRGLLPHTPTFFTVNALDFGYEPNAAVPSLWLQFLADLWPSDPDAIATLQEIFGYCLTADTRQQKAFLLVGPKRSGKGTIARILTRLVGIENVAAPTLASLGQNFGLAPLVGKRVAIISDARLGSHADQHAIAERLLSISGEDAITIDRKHRAAWTGRLQVRFLVLSNELPRLADASGALASRFIVLVLTRSFFGMEDLGLEAKLTTELPAILGWAIEGWQRLRERGYFVPPKSSAEAEQAMEDLSSPIGAFLRDRCTIKPGLSVPVDVLFGAWAIWCRQQGRDKPGTVQTFGRDLRAAFPGLRVSFPRSDGDRQRVYDGIGLVP